MTNRTFAAPTSEDINTACSAIQGHLVHTPVLPLVQEPFLSALGSNTHLKLELFQQAGSFKARGVFLAIKALSKAEKNSGVIAVSAGNHAIATAWAAKANGVDAKVCLPKTTDPFCITLCQELGAQTILCPTIAEAFAEGNRLTQDEGRCLLHPFESFSMTLGAATCATEFIQNVPNLDVAIVPIGGGGLISGMASVFKRHNPNIQVFGVEPVGAAVISKSLKSGHPETIDVQTIASSLAAPLSLPYSLSLIQQYVDKVVSVTDDELRHSMRLMAETLSLLPEAACAASLAAAMGPLRQEISGKNIGLIACGSNISVQRWQALLDQKN